MAVTHLKRFSIITFLIGCTLTSVGQEQHALHLDVPDSVHYTLFLGGQPLKEMVHGSTSIDSIPSGECLIDLVIHSSSSIHLRADFHKKAAYPAYLILEALPDSASVPFSLRRKPAEGEPEDYTHPAGQAANTLHLEVYKITSSTCAPPATPAFIEASTLEIESMAFERERMKHLASLLGSACLTTKQIRHLVALVEDDQRRFKLIKQAYSQCYDPSSYPALADLLYLSKNKEEFKTWINLR